MKNDIEEYMYIEWLQARENINAIKKRNKQIYAERKHLEADARGLSPEASRSYLVLREEEEF